MEQNILDVALCVIEYCGFFLFLNSLLECRFRGYIPLALVIASGALIMYFCQDFDTILKTVMGFFVLISGSSILFKEKLAIKISYSLILLFFVFIIDIILGNLLSVVISESFANVFYSDFRNRVILCLVIKALDILALLIAQRAFRRIYKNLRVKYWYLLSGVFIVLLASFLIFMSFYFDMQKDTEIASLFLFISLSFFAMSWIVIYFFAEICSGFQKENKMLALEKDNKSLEEALETQNLNSQTLSKIRHDITKHTTNAVALIESGKIDEATALLKSAGETAIRILPKYNINTGNRVVDTIISSKAALCESKGLKFTYKVEPLGEIHIENVDLSSLLSNLLDNAIEAAQRTANGYIRIEIFKYKAYYGICVENSFLGKNSIVHNGSQLLSTKSNNAMHGYGTQIIEDIAQKYNGDSTWNADGECFKSNVLLKI